jgi:type I restriction enzyme S subunit
VQCPKLFEQQQIASILSTIDEAIQKTDEVIAKTERLKKGMMRELLTKGIGHKEFKDTEIGRIPKEWEVVNLEGACVEITDGSHWSPKQVERSEYRIATVANLRETYVDIDSCKFISEEDYMRLVKEGDVPRKDDILFSKDGTIGIAFTFKQDSYKIGLLSSIAIIRPNHELLFSDFGAYALKSPNILMQITGWKTGTALRRIILDSLKRLKIMLPPLHEQRRIASILLSADDRLELLRKERTKLERIKKGFMNELLTGRIRVGVRS